jgi:hypothetical protein
MTQRTRSQLLAEINIIRNETSDSGNTKVRVANTLQDISDSSALLTDVPPGPREIYLPLVSGFQTAGSTYTLLGVLPPLNYGALGSGTPVFSFISFINTPSASTSQVRLYDVTNTNTIWESGIINGPNAEYQVGSSPVTLAADISMLEFWLSTPTITGGPASVLSAGIHITFS